MFLTTHYMEEAADADYVVILDHGQIAAEEHPLKLKDTLHQGLCDSVRRGRKMRSGH